MFARENGRVTLADAVKLTAADRNTLKLHFRNSVWVGVTVIALESKAN